jgi:hypothetical protein
MRICTDMRVIWMKAARRRRRRRRKRRRRCL